MRQYSKTRRKPIKPSQERSETQVLTGCNAERWKNKRKKKKPRRSKPGTAGTNLHVASVPVHCRLYS